MSARPLKTSSLFQDTLGSRRPHLPSFRLRLLRWYVSPSGAASGDGRNQTADCSCWRACTVHLCGLVCTEAYFCHPMNSSCQGSRRCCFLIGFHSIQPSSFRFLHSKAIAWPSQDIEPMSDVSLRQCFPSPRRQVFHLIPPQAFHGQLPAFVLPEAASKRSSFPPLCLSLMPNRKMDPFQLLPKTERWKMANHPEKKKKDVVLFWWKRQEMWPDSRAVVDFQSAVTK